MNIEEFVSGHRTKSKGKVKAAIAERWNSRVLPRGLQNMGRTGANAYLDSYGKNIAAPKVVELALCADSMQAPEMAAGFWEAAYNLTTGDSATFPVNGESVTDAPSQAPVKVGAKRDVPVLKEFPSDMQPGAIQTMQPTDAPEPQSKYILSREYLGQPKRDGQRNVLYGTPTVCVHQSRSTSIMGTLDVDIEKAACETANEVGAFILDGERYFLSATGSEHRTAAQAATANIEAGHGKIQPVTVYGVFKALYANGRDLRNEDEKTRIDAAAGIVALIHSYLPATGARIEAVPTAYTTAEKQALADRQKSEGREGEVWTLQYCNYSGGKGHKTDAVRTKYLEETEFTVLGIALSTTATRTIASIEIANASGKSVGNVGTGFNAQNSEQLIAAFKADPKNTKVLIRHQGFTETGAAWHSRLLEVM